MGEAALDLAEKLKSMSAEEVERAWRNMLVVKQAREWDRIVAAFPGYDGKTWPIAYEPYMAWREWAKAEVLKQRIDYRVIEDWYRNRPVEFIEHWVTTYDPRNAVSKRPTKMPLLLFKRQRELVTFLIEAISLPAPGLIEKCRDMGATWVCCAVSVFLWRFWPGAAVGWGSRKEELVDKIGDPKSVFDKIRTAIRELPPFLIPAGLVEADHLTFMKCINPENGSTITGEAGDNIGRGGRTLVYFKDESAHYPRPDLVEAALADNTNCQIDLSTPNGLGNVFHRRRETGIDYIVGQPLVPFRANVFIMDWRDHPGKSVEWYEARKKQAEDEGLRHVFAQEVDRDYAASVEGIIIRPEWIRSSIDAHLKLGLTDHDGPWSAGLDVSDGEGGDTNALAAFKGIVLRRSGEWGGVDTGETTRRTVQILDGIEVEVQYDCIGVGAGVKAEANRLAQQGLLSDRISFIPWSAAASPLGKDEPVNPSDADSPTNGAMFGNLKAQAWWMVARRFEKTHRMVTQAERIAKGETINPDEFVMFETHELISIDGNLPDIRQIEKELAQPVAKKRPGDMKLIVDKKPEGTKSPNKGDAIIMAAHPTDGLRHVFPTAQAQFSVTPFRLPPIFLRGFAMKVEPEQTVILFGAWDRDQDVLYIHVESKLWRRSPADAVAAIHARGKWLPGTIDTEETGEKDRRAVLEAYQMQGLPLLTLADQNFEAGVVGLAKRIAEARLKVFSTCQGFFTDYAAYRHTETGVTPSAFMDCARILCRPNSLAQMRLEPASDVTIPYQPVYDKSGY